MEGSWSFLVNDAIPLFFPRTVCQKTQNISVNLLAPEFYI
jgi:hypothetical protein